MKTEDSSCPSLTSNSGSKPIHNHETIPALRSRLMYCWAFALSLLGFSVQAQAQTPGNLPNTNLKLWLKSDAGTSTTTDNAAIATWTNQFAPAGTSNNATGANAALGTRPTYQNQAADLYNFNPTVNFGGSGYFATNGLLDDLQANEDISLFTVTNAAAGTGVLFAPNGNLLGSATNIFEANYSGITG